MTRTAVVLLAAGAGSRVGTQTNKVLLTLAGLPTLCWSVRTVLGLEGVSRVVIVVRAADRSEVEGAVAPLLGAHAARLVDGGATRHDSETNALAALRSDIETGEVQVVAVHDAARPLASADLWRRTIAAADRSGGALPVVPLRGIISVDGPVAPPSLVGVQTPQAFRAASMLAAYDAAAADGFAGTDTASCLERYSDLVVMAVPGEPTNVKVTFAADVPLAEQLLSRRARR